MYFANNTFSFPYPNQMYQFMVNIGKEGGQALRRLEFIWEFSDSKYHLLSKLRDCTNLQRLYIGLDFSTMPDLEEFNERKSKSQKKNLWEWEGQGEQVWELIPQQQQPDSLELKIREAYYANVLGRGLTTLFDRPASDVVEKDRKSVV